MKHHFLLREKLRKDVPGTRARPGARRVESGDGIRRWNQGVESGGGIRGWNQRVELEGGIRGMHPLDPHLPPPRASAVLVLPKVRSGRSKAADLSTQISFISPG